MRASLLRRSVLAATVLAVLSSVTSVNTATSVSAAPAPTGSQTFTTAQAHTFVVPDLITSITVAAFGAAGGSSGGSQNSGMGGSVVATVSVTPGETLFIHVGGRGEPAGPDANGGFNGGGVAPSYGAGGGGASDVRQGGTALEDRIVVAGGGGGSSYGRGGNGGRAATGGWGGLAGGGGGQPGTASGPGIGGTGAGSAGDGTFGAGGAGSLLAGGGGGGGYYGGAGGAGDGRGTGGGGGGGSSWVTESATRVSYRDGDHAGDGVITLYWPSATTFPPSRVVDTRGRGSTPIAPDAETPVDLTDVGLPPETTAVEVNLTVDNPVAAGYATVYPCGTDTPDASNLNFGAGQTVSNSAIVGLGADHRICVKSTAGTDILIDVTYAFSPSANRLVAATPIRLVDTRVGPVVASGTVTKIALAGHAGVSADATAATLQLTATDSHVSGYLTAYACADGRPNISNLNAYPAANISNRVTTGIDINGDVCIFNEQATHLIVDLSAAYTATSSARLTAVAPTRIIDTRSGPKRQTNHVTVIDVGPSIAAAINVTVDQPELAGYLTAWPCGQARPASSGGNFAAGQTVATGLTIASSATGTICLTTSTPAHLIVDLQGRFQAG